MRHHLLAHWTGKDLDGKYVLSELREKYVERLINTLRTGLWLTHGSAEFVEGWERDPGMKRNLVIPESLSRVCFTELHPKDASDHVVKYGHMAFVFKRSFIERCGGGPVIYSTFRDWKVTNLDEVRKILDYLSKEESVYLKTQGCILKKEYIEKLQNAFNQVLANLKNMHSPCKHDGCDPSGSCLKYDFYDEFEWRIIYTQRIEDEGYLQKVGNNDSPATHYLKFKNEDLEYVILPDEETLKLAQNMSTSDATFCTLERC